MIAYVLTIMLAAAPMKPCKDIVAIKKKWDENQWYIQKVKDGPWLPVTEGFVVGLKCYVENLTYETT